MFRNLYNMGCTNKTLSICINDIIKIEGHHMYKCITHHCQHQAPIITNFISKAKRHFMVYIDIITLLQYIILLQSCYCIFTDAKYSIFNMTWTACTACVTKNKTSQYHCLYLKYLNVSRYLQAKIMSRQTYFEEFPRYNTESKTTVHRANSHNVHTVVSSTDVFKGATWSVFNISASSTNSFWHFGKTATNNPDHCCYF